jgi:hypothetical protein
VARDSDPLGHKWTFKYLVPPVALAILFFGIPDFPQAARAARNEGTPGAFTSLRSDCAVRGGCSYYGEFVSNDRTIVLKDVLIDDGVDRVGESVPAQALDNSASQKKVYELNSREWLWLTILVVGSALFLLGWSYFVLVPWIRKLRSR